MLQTLGHFALGHTDPADYADFLRQRVEANYFAAALLVPEKFAVRLPREAKRDRALAIDDFRDVFGVSYETAAHRFTNLATHHFGIPVHFTRTRSGTIYKAYENDDVRFPTDVTGAIEGQVGVPRVRVAAGLRRARALRLLRQFTDTPAGTYWCTAHVEPDAAGEFAVTVGAPYQHARWFRGGDTTPAYVSTCPAPSCCRRPPAELVGPLGRAGVAQRRVHTHLLAALPPGTFPGVDTTDVYEFLDKHTPTADLVIDE